MEGIGRKGVGILIHLIIVRLIIYLAFFTEKRFYVWGMNNGGF
ncbi:hypothetical protein QNH10_12540 [Sporosarcina thermotolerans]|nr:hypothetical protein [Sporosarcina thermotolerans]WHT47108.1 hypothetical protein QNH10_12540 [Sporosarcina thermotolerans]